MTVFIVPVVKDSFSPVLWQLQEEYIAQALDWLEKTHDLPPGSRPKWTCEATEPLRRWLARSPVGDNARFRALFQAGRIGVAALRRHLSSGGGCGMVLDSCKCAPASPST